MFSSIVCATRFKMFDQQGDLLNVRCFKCGGVDSFLHMLVCAGVGPIPPIIQANYGPLVSFLCRMIESTTEHAPVWPVPIYRSTEEDLSLTAPSSAGSERAAAFGADEEDMSCESLSFDGED